jgi:hypothetical protein
MDIEDDLLPAPPTAHELWWVAVEGSSDPSGGWLILADPGPEGAKAIATTLAQAGISFLAAATAQDLTEALSIHEELPTLALRVEPDGTLQVSRHVDPPTQVMVDLRLRYPSDRIILVDDVAPAKSLLGRMQVLLASKKFEGIRLDLRSPPRGQGAWGLALASA